VAALLDRLLKPAEAAESLGVSISTLSNWRVQGIGPAWVKTAGRINKRGGRVCYRESALQAYLDSCPGRAAG
jgi:predicted site-specific integrase-resolvase